jgi:diaminopimelate epimerase
VNREIRFTKMHGAGNDFVMIDGTKENIAIEKAEIAALCDRHRGIGADGLIIIQSSRERDFKMRYHNSDGGEAEMCGNGARCAALFAHRCGLADMEMVIDTAAGPVSANMAEDEVTIGVGDVTGLQTAIELEGIDYVLHYAISGVPHVALIDEMARDVSREDFFDLARAIRFHPYFGGKGTNVNLVAHLSNKSLYYRTYERGVEAETLACGTGAVAISVIAERLGLVSAPVECETSGGDILKVEFDPADEGARNCRLTGPAVVAFEGTFIKQSYSGA